MMGVHLATKGRISGKGVTYGTLGYIYHRYISGIVTTVKTEFIHLKSYVTRMIGLKSEIDL